MTSTLTATYRIEDRDFNLAFKVEEGEGEIGIEYLSTEHGHLGDFWMPPDVAIDLRFALADSLRSIKESRTIERPKLRIHVSEDRHGYGRACTLPTQ